MAFETRRGKRYFYRSRRIGGCVKKEYLGSGPAALAAARQLEQARVNKEANRAAVAALAAELEPIDSLVADLEAGADTLAEALLLCSGYHRHHQGEWRLKHARDD